MPDMGSATGTRIRRIMCRRVAPKVYAVRKYTSGTESIGANDHGKHEDTKGHRQEDYLSYFIHAEPGHRERDERRDGNIPLAVTIGAMVARALPKDP